jgi:glycosyltransferase involved in cell wall biosynthesis
MPMTVTQDGKSLPRSRGENAENLRIALFSGNYNGTRDGANQALNRLVAFLEKKGATVQVYSPTSRNPAFAPAGRLISVPSWPLPLRADYRLALPLPRETRAELKAFRPDILHISSPDPLGCSAVSLARKWHIPAVASIHTRFETYFRYYGLGACEPAARLYLRWLYNRCQQIYVPTPCMAEILRADGIRADIRYWSRGIDREQFTPSRRDMGWRRSLGIRDDEVAIAFVGRIVMEKGLAAFADTIQRMQGKGLPFRCLVVGAGPAEAWFRERLPGAIFTGALSGDALGRAFASADIFFNPSTTETFGNVNLEAMASGLPVVGARASGNNSIIEDGVSGRLVDPTDPGGYAQALETMIASPKERNLMGEAGLKESLRYDWDDILSAVATHYLGAIAAYPPRTALAPFRTRLLPKFFARNPGVK